GVGGGWSGRAARHFQTTQVLGKRRLLLELPNHLGGVARALALIIEFDQTADGARIAFTEIDGLLVLAKRFFDAPGALFQLPAGNVDRDPARAGAGYRVEV